MKTIAIMLCLASTAYADVYKVSASRGELVLGKNNSCDDATRTQLRSFVRSLVAVVTTKNAMTLDFTDYHQTSDEYFGNDPRYGYFKLGNKKTSLLVVITDDSVLDINLVSHEDGQTCYEKWEGAVSR